VIPKKNFRKQEKIEHTMMHTVIFLLSALSVVHVQSAAAPAPAPAPTATQLVAPLQDYLNMMETGSPLTASVYLVTQLTTWNNSIAYCQNTMSTMLNTNCYLAEILTLAQRTALSQAMYGNTWNVWVGAYLKPSKNLSKWLWYHTGYDIVLPNSWMAGYPTANGAPNNYAANVYTNPSWGVDLNNLYAPTTAFYFACTCW